jgi:hypothetical protein
MLPNIIWKRNIFKRLNSKNNGYIYGICNIIKSFFLKTALGFDLN